MIATIIDRLTADEVDFTSDDDCSIGGKLDRKSLALGALGALGPRHCYIFHITPKHEIVSRHRMA